jgi:hypothetical protein
VVEIFIKNKKKTYMNTISIIDCKICTRKCAITGGRIHIFEFLWKNRAKTVEKPIP